LIKLSIDSLLSERFSLELQRIPKTSALSLE
jgi:hypothetical protein